MRGFLGVILICSWLAFGACARQLPGQPVEYPRGWPLPELTAPHGAKRAMIVTMNVAYSEPLHYGYVIDGAIVGEYTNYVSGFVYDGGWDEAVEHVEECLESHRVRVLEERQDKLTSLKKYDVVDRRVGVVLYRERIKRKDHYHLRIIAY